MAEHLLRDLAELLNIPVRQITLVGTPTMGPGSLVVEYYVYRNATQVLSDELIDTLVYLDRFPQLYGHYRNVTGSNETVSVIRAFTVRTSIDPNNQTFCDQRCIIGIVVGCAELVGCCCLWFFLILRWRRSKQKRDAKLAAEEKKQQQLPPTDIAAADIAAVSAGPQRINIRGAPRTAPKLSVVVLPAVTTNPLNDPGAYIPAKVIIRSPEEEKEGVGSTEPITEESDPPSSDHEPQPPPPRSAAVKPIVRVVPWTMLPGGGAGGEAVQGTPTSAESDDPFYPPPRPATRPQQFRPKGLTSSLSALGGNATPALLPAAAVVSAPPPSKGPLSPFEENDHNDFDPNQHHHHAMIDLHLEDDEDDEAEANDRATLREPFTTPQPQQQQQRTGGRAPSTAVVRTTHPPPATFQRVSNSNSARGPDVVAIDPFFDDFVAVDVVDIADLGQP